MHPFEAMAEPVRRRIVDLLSSGEHTSGQIAELVGGEYHITRTATSKHLRILRDAGFVDVRADLAWRWYRLTPEAIGILEHAVRELREKWTHRVGWDADAGEEHDPLEGFAHLRREVPRKGPGRPHRRGQRGRLDRPDRASEPDAGLFPGF
jgi:DNA-binding transcriptional ArsR family regulator